MTGNLLSTTEIEPGSNNISHNEKEGKVSLSEISLVLASCLTYEVTFQRIFQYFTTNKFNNQGEVSFTGHIPQVTV